MNRRTVIFAAALFLLGAWGASAHEGHSHTILGTVTAHTAKSLDVKTRDGKTVSVVLNDKTVVTRGTSKLAAKDLAVGQRVVVDVGDGKSPLLARAIKVGAEKK